MGSEQEGSHEWTGQPVLKVPETRQPSSMSTMLFSWPKEEQTRVFNQGSKQRQSLI